MFVKCPKQLALPSTSGAGCASTSVDSSASDASDASAASSASVTSGASDASGASGASGCSNTSGAYAASGDSGASAVSPASGASCASCGLGIESRAGSNRMMLLRQASVDFSKLLPPIGVFWDIENCHVPKGKSATAIAQAIRVKFFEGYREADFIVVCDVTKEKSSVIQELNDAQVNLIHVAATCKNAADEKLRQSIRRFADTYTAPAAILLISGDINFAADLNDLRHRKKFHVILLHQVNASRALVLHANEHYNFGDLIEGLPMKGPEKESCTYELFVSNLPEGREPAKVKHRLKQLSENSGGRVGIISKGVCNIRFPNIVSATRTNNGGPNGENDPHYFESSQLLLTQTQQLQMVSQHGYMPRGMAQAGSSRPMIPNQANGSNGSTCRFLRGTHGDCGYGSNGASRSMPYLEDDCESLASGDPYFEVSPFPIGEFSSPVDLHVSGLDPHMDLLIVKNLLTGIFKAHVEVLSVSVFALTDGSVVASVKVPSLQDAQYAISKLQRRRIGVRRITIAYQNSSRNQRQLVRSQVAQLLMEMPQSKIPLFRFTDLFKSRFLNSVSVSELNKMKDVCVITEEESGRMISANSRCHANVSPRREKKEATVPYCQVHSQRTLSDSELPILPTVNIGLELLGNRIKALLESHSGKLFLPSLGDCYQAQFGPFPETPGGVPLEHLVSCISGIEVSHGHGCFKYLTWSQATKSGDDHAKTVSPMLFGTMSVFTRELLDLLKDTPKCLLPFSQFIPSYHRRYGRQCRVSDYGYTKLLDLLESLPHVLQVIGNGSHKVVTLSHKAQMRRFTTDLLRILKSQANKQIDLSEFGAQYEKVIGRAWDPCHYGLCELEDLLGCIPQSAALVERKEDGRVLVSIPKREQTPEEIQLTRKFAQEVVELLKRVPNCMMEFNKFVPAYHNQFGRQCRVASYGCFKLIELFESIPDTVSIQEDTSNGEKYLYLTMAKKLQVFADKIRDILSMEGGIMWLFRLDFAYRFYQYESVVSPFDCSCQSFEELLNKIPEYVKIEGEGHDKLVILRNESDMSLLRRRVRFLFLEKDKLPVGQFFKVHYEKFHQKITAETIMNKIPEVVRLVKKGGETFVQLSPISLFANQMYLLLIENKGKIPLLNFESSYLQRFKKPCLPSQFGFPTLSSLLNAIPETVTIQSSGYYTHRRVITLNPNFKVVGFQTPDTFDESAGEGAGAGAEGAGRSYDLWQSESLFPSWSDINGLALGSIKPPHPSELPLPSAKLSSPIQKRQRPASGARNEAEASSTTDESAPGVSEPDKAPPCENHEKVSKRMNRIAAHFESLT